MKHLQSSLTLFSLVLLLLTSCATPYNVAYFQDMPIEQQVQIIEPQQVIFKPSDRISVLVSARDAALSSLFSLHSNYTIGEEQSGGSGSQASEYIIGGDGCIDFPILGRIKAAGFTREELQASIKQQIMDRDLIKDPVVTIDYVNLFVTMIGATGVGHVSIDRDKFTLLDAIAMSGDLDITGQRENIRVIRETSDNTRIAYEVNICSAEDLYNSPVFYLQQNDVIYIEPNNKVKRTATEYGSRMVNYTFWTSLITTAFTMVALFK